MESRVLSKCLLTDEISHKTRL